jgi:Amt family ammonium transporter
MAQCVGSLIVCTATFASAMAMFAALNAVRMLRVSKEGELQGLDIDQHGISAYPEYVISALTAPHGMGRETVGSGNVPVAHAKDREEELVGSR